MSFRPEFYVREIGLFRRAKASRPGTGLTGSSPSVYSAGMVCAYAPGNKNNTDTAVIRRQKPALLLTLPQLVRHPICAKRFHRHISYRGQPALFVWRATGTTRIAGNRRYSTGTIGGALPYYTGSSVGGGQSRGQIAVSYLLVLLPGNIIIRTQVPCVNIAGHMITAVVCYCNFFFLSGNVYE